MGLGKTTQAIAACHALFAAGDVRRAVIVVPASLKPQWAREWRAFTDLELVTVDGAPDERAALYRRRADGVLLVNYEQLLRDLAGGPALRARPRGPRRGAAHQELGDQVGGGRQAARARVSARADRHADGESLDELASIMEWVDDLALEPKWRLPSWHSVRADGSREVIGARNLDTLRTRLAPSMLRRVRSEVLTQLPPRSDTRIPVEMTEAQRAAHDELVQPIAALLRKTRVRGR